MLDMLVDTFLGFPCLGDATWRNNVANVGETVYMYVSTKPLKVLLHNVCGVYIIRMSTNNDRICYQANLTPVKDTKSLKLLLVGTLAVLLRLLFEIAAFFLAELVRPQTEA